MNGATQVYQDDWEECTHNRCFWDESGYMRISTAAVNQCLDVRIEQYGSEYDCEHEARVPLEVLAELLRRNGYEVARR